MIVPYEEESSISASSSYKDIEKYRKHKKRQLSYFELVELQKLQFRNARMPRRIREVRPITPPEVIEEESSSKPVHRWRPRKQKHTLSEAALKAIQALCITDKQVKKLQKKFDRIAGKSGDVTKAGFWDELKVHPSPFTDKLFEMIDSDGSGVMDFSEYISILITYCIFNQEDILRFAFSCFDEDASGFIDSEEINRLITMVNTNPAFGGMIQKARAKINADEDGKISFNEFMELNRTFPLLLLPAFQLQDSMQKHTLGQKDWIKVMENMSHSQKTLDAMAKQFGKPMNAKQWKQSGDAWAASRKFPMLDIEYIDSMRPSKVARLPPPQDEDEDAEPLESDDEFDDQDGQGEHRGEAKIGMLEDRNGSGSVASITSQDSQNRKKISKRVSRFDAKVSRGALESQPSRRLSRSGSSFGENGRKSLIRSSGPAAALAAADARQRAKEKQKQMLEDEKKRLKAEKGGGGGAFKLPSISMPRMLTPSKKKKKDKQAPLALLEAPPNSSGKQPSTSASSGGKTKQKANGKQLMLQNKPLSSGSSANSDVGFDLTF